MIILLLVLGEGVAGLLAGVLMVQDMVLGQSEEKACTGTTLTFVLGKVIGIVQIQCK